MLVPVFIELVSVWVGGEEHSDEVVPHEVPVVRGGGPPFLKAGKEPQGDPCGSLSAFAQGVSHVRS